MIVGILGTKGSGKTTVAKYLVTKYGWKERTFAYPLKEACKKLFVLNDEQIYGSQEEKETPDPRWFGCSPRKILQYVGTDLLREQLAVIMPELQKNIFTHHMKIWIDEAKKSDPDLNLVIHDVRFDNECKFVRNDLNGIVIKINRQDSVCVDMHPSERDILDITDYDYLIDNDGSLEELYQSIDNIIEKIRV